MKVYEITAAEVRSLEIELALEAGLAKLESGEWTAEQHMLFIQLMDQEGLYA